ncbi:MAG: SBBP repeat-containing protein [Bacteroidia bacterium]
MIKNLVTVCGLLCISLLQANKEPVSSMVANEPKKSIIAFTENKGQVYDQNYKPRPDVLFGVMAGDLAIHIKNSGVSYQLYRTDSYKEVEDEFSKEKRKEIDQQSIYRIDLNWLNANKNFTKSTDNTLPGYNNYYLESCPDGALEVKSYSGITLHNLYRGIDLHYYEKNGELKHDYIVAAFSDYKQIQIEVKGASISKNNDGSILFSTPLGKIQEGAPLVYQNGKQLKAKWEIINNILSFEIENYNPNEKLIIDPVTRIWGTYYGGTQYETGFASTIDILNNIYLVGRTGTTTGTLIATTGSHQSTNGGSYDAFIAKFNSAGFRLWASYYGGSGNDYGYACATDNGGNNYTTGISNSNTGISTIGSHQFSFGGTWDGFLVKFNPNGVRQWGTYYGGNNGDEGHGCSCDPSGNIYLTGWTMSGNAIATFGSHQPSLSGPTDAFLIKFNGAGIRQWGTYYGGNDKETGKSISFDNVGNVYFCGLTSSSNSISIATANGHQTVYGGGADDAFLAKFNSSGTRLWGTYYGGGLHDNCKSCKTDGQGNIYISGRTESNTFIATNGSHQFLNGGGLYDAYLVKFNSIGTRLWGTYYGGSGDDQGLFCTTDSNDNVYLTGWTNSSNGSVIATPGSHQSLIGGGQDAFVVKFDSLGVRQSGTYYGDTGDDGAYSCSTDAFNNIYIAGQTSSSTSTAIASIGSHQSFNAGNYDAFLVKFGDCVSINPSATVNSTVCSGSSINFSTSISTTNTPLYFWNGPNSFTSNLQNPIITSASSLNIGVYTITVNNGGCIETNTTEVTTILTSPTVAVNSGSICNGNSFTITASGAVSYTIEGGFSVVSPSTNSTYTVVGTGTSGCVSANIASCNILVYALPTIAVNSGSICNGNSFTITPNGADTYTIQGGNSIVTPSSNSSYSIIGTSTAGCVSSNTAICNIMVNTTPTIGVNSGTICSGDSFTIIPSGANTYTIEGGTAIVSPSINTSYTVVGTSAVGCFGANTATSNVAVVICTGLNKNDLSHVNVITIGPNPTNGIIIIELSNNANATITNQLGQKVFNEHFYKGQTKIDITKFSNGIYYLSISNNQEKIFYKIIKQ